MLEALWSVEFIANTQSFGAGVIIFETSRAFGGDSNYFYTGKYELDRDIFKGEAKVTHYFGQPNSVFGALKQFTLKLEGRIAEPTFDLHGYVVERPEFKIAIRLTKRADLP